MLKAVLKRSEDTNALVTAFAENSTSMPAYRKKYDKLLKNDLNRQIEKVGYNLRARMPWLDQGRS